MKYPQTYINSFCLFILASILFISCQTSQSENAAQITSKKEPAFQSYTIADSLELIWAHCPADITGDGIVDLVFINNNGRGGYLGYFQGKKAPGIWEKQIIAETAPNGGTFAQGDMECADMDFDGDIDLVVAEHPGEWDESTAPSKLYWYENPGWEPHYIGDAIEFVKDFSLVDFNKDQKMDIALLTFEHNTFSIFQQNDVDEWTLVQKLENFGNLHEGMGAGDIDGDGWEDIVANAHIFYNPGKDLQAGWRKENLDEKWNSQTGDWSRNGTKTFLRDLDKDGKTEIFISHSERPGYPLSWYKLNEDGTWKENIISDSVPACHTLQVFDFDADGDFDVLAGINKTRAKDLGIANFEVTIFLSEADYTSWKPLIIEKDGIYNGQVVDFDSDGDFDIFRYQTHDAKDFQLYKNTLVN